MISIVRSLIPKRPDAERPERLELLGECLDEKCEEYVGFCWEICRKKETRVPRNISMKVEHSESV